MHHFVCLFLFVANLLNVAHITACRQSLKCETLLSRGSHHHPKRWMLKAVYEVVEDLKVGDNSDSPGAYCIKLLPDKRKVG